MLVSPATTVQYYQAGIIAAPLAEEWPTYDMYEYEYAPDGHASDLCVDREPPRVRQPPAGAKQDRRHMTATRPYSLTVQVIATR
jgi:hypothetical protein